MVQNSMDNTFCEFRLNYFLVFIYGPKGPSPTAEKCVVGAAINWTASWIAALARSGTHLGMPQ